MTDKINPSRRSLLMAAPVVGIGLALPNILPAQDKEQFEVTPT